MRLLLLLPVFLLSSPLATMAQMVGIEVTVLQRTSVSDHPDLESVTIQAIFSPGATTGWHTHPGDEYAVVLDGHLTLRSREGDPRTVSADSAYHNQRGVIHETVNETDKPAVITATFILKKGEPITVPWSETGN